MNDSTALQAFSALAQPTRLAVFRLLIGAGSEGMLAGEISDAMDVRQNTMSANLSVLLKAGLVKNQREGRGIRYFADTEGLRDLVGFLLSDCCGGKPEQCGPLLQDIVPTF